MDEHSATITAILIGGPADLPATLRTQRVSVDQQTIKVPHGRGYEHFEPDSVSRGRDGEPVPFHWKMRTRIAE